MATESDQIETALLLKEAQEAVRGLVDDVWRVSSVTHGTTLFPHGITKVIIELRIAAVELKFEVSGPESGGEPNSSSQLLPLNSNSASTAFQFEDPVANILEHRALLPPTVAAVGIELADLDLAEYANSAAVKLKADFPTVVFTSGRRTVNQQANAMAGNIITNRKWIEQTYASSTERDILQKWVDDHPEATTKAAIITGLVSIMSSWTDAQRIKLSRHFAGLAFDVQPTSSSALKDAIKALPNLVKFLDSEGGITIWHAEFKSN